MTAVAALDTMRVGSSAVKAAEAPKSQAVGHDEDAR